MMVNVNVSCTSILIVSDQLKSLLLSISVVYLLAQAVLLATFSYSVLCVNEAHWFADNQKTETAFYHDTYLSDKFVS